MLEAVSSFLIYLITHILDCYGFSKLVNKRFDFNLKNICIVLISSIINYYLGTTYNGVVRLLSSNLITFILLKLIYKKSWSKTLVGGFLILIGYAIAELVYVLILYCILFNIFSSTSFDGFIGDIVSNIFIFSIYIAISYIKPIMNFLSNIINWCDEKKIINILSNCIVAMVICSILMFPFYFNNIEAKYMIILYAVLISILIFIVGYFNQKSTNNKLSVEYEELLEYSKSYEKEVAEKSKNQHEYKNQLVMIDNLVPKTNKKAKDYIKKLINEENSIDENNWMVKLKNIPDIGIKGFINFKINKMIKNNIVVYVNVDESLNNKTIWKNVENNLEKVSKIIGVYLDNAIEAAVESKDKQIIIEFIDNDDTIEFILSNSYKGIINFDEIDKQGYSTKGKGRGSGLALANEIIKNNKFLKQSREINGKFYVQKLYIKK